MPFLPPCALAAPRLLLDGPAVLGRAAMDEIDDHHGNRSLCEGLVAAMRAQSITGLPTEALIACSPPPSTARRWPSKRALRPRTTAPFSWR
jgi:hypothetical protein